MTQDVTNPKHWIADEGKVFKSLVNGQNMGNEIVLAEIHIDGRVDDDKIENYEEVDDPNPQPIAPEG